VGNVNADDVVEVWFLTFSALGMFIDIEPGSNMLVQLILHPCARQGNLALSCDLISLSFSRQVGKKSIYIITFILKSDKYKSNIIYEL